MTIAILTQFRKERQAAIAQDDPMAALLALATVSATGLPEVRTLVLRELEDQLAIFINRSSPKWAALQAQPQVSFVTYWPSSQLQYRFECTTKPIAKAQVNESWLLRPDAPKRIDHLYQHGAPQSGSVANRATLLAQAAALPDTVLTEPTPDAAGVFLMPLAIERLDLNMNGQPHDRRRYSGAHNWQAEVLMP